MEASDGSDAVMSDKKELAANLRAAADVLDPPGWGKKYKDPIPEHDTKRRCWLRFRKHRWSDSYDRMYHRWKICLDCGTQKRTHHLSCGVACWGGPV